MMAKLGVAMLTVAVLVGCRGGLDSLRDPGADLDIFFPRMPPANAIPAALLAGTLVLRDGCLWIETEPRQSYLALWPAGSYPVKSGNIVEVRASDGTRLAAVGAVVVATGGELRDLDHVSQLIGRDPPEACQAGMYWRVFLTSDRMP